MPKFRPSTFPVNFDKGSFRRDGRYCIVNLNHPYNKLVVNNITVNDLMPIGTQATEIVQIDVRYDKNGDIINQSFVVEVEGWTDEVELE